MMGSISDCYPEYSELQIRKAFAKAEQEDSFKKGSQGRTCSEGSCRIKKKVGKGKKADDGSKQTETDEGKMKELSVN